MKGINIIKVAQILYAGLGGHGSVVFSLLDSDKCHEWQPVLGFLGIESMSPTYVDACLTSDIPFSYFAATPGKPWKTWPSIFNWLFASEPEVILLHSVTALLPCWWFAHNRGVPLIVVEHQANSLKRRSDWLYSFLAMLLADRVIVLTPAYNQELRARLGLFYRSNKVVLIPNGIDTVKFKPSGRPFFTGQIVRLGMASRFTGIKRHDVLVKMMVELRERAPAINWQLSLAGDGESFSEIDQMVQYMGLESCVGLPGQLSDSAMINWYKSQDIYLHASEGETLSTALLQAMSTGLPIVASDVPGIRDLLLGESVCGVLIARQSPKGFAEAVIELTNSTASAKTLAQSGRKLVVSTYSQTKMFTGYAQMLKEISDISCTRLKNK
jgi:glycosyltransferase involved in cell wall biosynthesis